jgi:parallel beta-helix repeat protein
MNLYKLYEAVHLLKKCFIIGIFVVSVLSLVIPSNGMIQINHYESKIVSRDVLYVGGLGPNNFTKIQDAISNATEGDTVFVYADSSPYYEHVIIDVSIDFIGENKTTTIIDGENSGDVVVFDADNISMTGFTVQHSGNNPKIDAGIESHSNGNLITGNNIIHNGEYAIGILVNGSSETVVENNYISENGNEGIFLENATYCVMRKNEITHNGHCAIVISQSTANTVINNIMCENYATVSLWPGAIENEIAWNLMAKQEFSGVGIWPGAHQNYIHDNYLSNNSLYGFLITRANGNIIANNTIWGSNEGMHLIMANSTIVRFNNFIRNNVSVFFENSSLNRWKRNYWDDHRGIFPKCIWGIIRIPWNKKVVIRWVNLDWFPAVTPYDIPRTDEGFS